jgi:hypothetical protein
MVAWFEAGGWGRGEDYAGEFETQCEGGRNEVSVVVLVFPSCLGGGQMWFSVEVMRGKQQLERRTITFNARERRRAKADKQF